MFSPLFILSFYLTEFVLAFFFISIIGLIIGTFTDLKQRIISNKLTYGMIAIGIILHAILAFLQNNFMILIVDALIVILTFACAYGLYKLGVWAGGDVKLFTALAALNPFNFAVLRDLLGLGTAFNGLFASISWPVFPLTLFIFSVFCMVPYGAIIALNGLRKNLELRKKLKKDLKSKIIQSLMASAAIIGLTQLLLLFNITLWAIIPILIVIGFIWSKVRLGLTVILFIVGIYLGQFNAFMQFVYLFLFFALLYSFIKLFLISRSEVLKKEIKITELEEGMIPSESIYLIEGKVQRVQAIKIGNFIKYFSPNNLENLLAFLKPQGKEIISSKKARGVTDEEINQLKGFVKKGLLEDKIAIKLTAPMIPAVLIAYLLLQIIGDALWQIIF